MRPNKQMPAVSSNRRKQFTDILEHLFDILPVYGFKTAIFVSGGAGYNRVAFDCLADFEIRELMDKYPDINLKVKIVAQQSVTG